MSDAATTNEKSRPNPRKVREGLLTRARAFAAEGANVAMLARGSVGLEAAAAEAQRPSRQWSCERHSVMASCLRVVRRPTACGLAPVCGGRVTESEGFSISSITPVANEGIGQWRPKSFNASSSAS